MGQTSEDQLSFSVVIASVRIQSDKDESTCPGRTRHTAMLVLIPRESHVRNQGGDQGMADVGGTDIFGIKSRLLP